MLVPLVENCASIPIGPLLSSKKQPEKDTHISGEQGKSTHTDLNRAIETTSQGLPSIERLIWTCTFLLGKDKTTHPNRILNLFARSFH
jgi:hypothetical protein